jgi:hypothetical protein
MGSFSRSGRAFQPDEIAMLQQAFDAIWTTLIAHRPSQADNDELRTAVSEKLCDIAASGITDVQLLRSLTLASLPLVMPVVPLPQDLSCSPPEHELL